MTGRIARDDAGFTLPELLVAMTVTAVIMPVLFSTFVTAFRTTDGSVERIAASHDATLSSNYFVPDVQSAESISLADEPTCKAPTGSNRLLTLKSTTAAGTVFTGYAVVTGTEKTLVRYKCTGTTVESSVTVAHDLGADPTVTCPTGSLATAPCVANSRRVLLTVADVTGYSFTLDASRRTTA